MAGDWIKVQTCTPDKPEVHQIAERLGIDPDAVTGKLIRIWCWADQQTADGNAASVTKSLLDRVSGVTGFADSLISVGWLEKTDAGFLFPNFDRHNGNSAKTRASVAKRVGKHRKTAESDSLNMKRKCNAETVTTALPEKRREEKRRDIETQIAAPPSVAAVAKHQRFSKPSVQDIIGYVLEIGGTIDGKQFWDYYESNGWKVGRNAMKDWKATVRQWQARSQTNGTNQRQQPQTAAERREQLNASSFDWIRQAAAEAEREQAELASGSGLRIEVSSGT